LLPSPLRKAQFEGRAPFHDWFGYGEMPKRVAIPGTHRRASAAGQPLQCAVPRGAAGQRSEARISPEPVGVSARENSMSGAQYRTSVEVGRTLSRSNMRIAVALLALMASGGSPALGQQVQIGSGSVVATVQHLKAGQFVWAPQIAPSGPVLLIVNLRNQRAVLFRNGVPIAATTVSTGKPGHSTPVGVFTILQKQIEHYSSLYDSAPMPYMQRLTWGGVALHAGKLPGYPASHGCIRLPADFAQRLYGITRLGMMVVVTDRDVAPRVAPSPQLVEPDAADQANVPIDWHPERSPTGPVSIVVSAADKRALILRNGVIIGSGPVIVDGGISGTWAYALRSMDSTGQHWIRMQLDSATAAADVRPTEWQRFHSPDAFRKDVASVVDLGTTVVVTSDSLEASATGVPVTVLEDGPDKRH